MSNDAQENIEKQNVASQSIPTNTNIESKLDLSDYNEFLEFKKFKEAQKKSTQSESVSVNEEVARDIKIAEQKRKEDKNLIEIASELEELESLAKKHLSNKKFLRASMEAKNIPVQEIILEQKRALVGRFIKPDHIKAVGKVDSVKDLQGSILDVLYKMAKVEAKNIENYNATVSSNSIDSTDTTVDVSSFHNINDPYFSPRNNRELKDGVANRLKQRAIKQFGNIGLKLVNS